MSDYFYVDAVSQLLREAHIVDLDEKIELVPASNAGKVVYYATILHARKLRVAALLDSDSAGDKASNQDALVQTLGNKAVIRTKDAYTGPVTGPKIEDLLRETVVHVAKNKLEWDVSTAAHDQPERSIVDIFTSEVGDFSRYRLAKAFVNWTRDHKASDLPHRERSHWKALIERINATLK